MAEITWLGHSCFRIRGRDAIVLMDPVSPESGYDMRQPSADIVTVSHHHKNHAALDLVKPGFMAITGPGEYEIREIFLSGIATFHDDERGKRLGKNTIFLVEIEDLIFCHAGDLGHALTEEQSESLSSVDVLILPVGGGPTLDATAAAELIGQIEPSVVIPMQFRTDRGDFDRDPLDPFLKKFGIGDIEVKDRVNLKKSDLSETIEVVVLRPT
ncbi:MAG TPA: MBL fold metallo-hydrolase [Nitrolancea sp.]|jgi:L-ascorbate metabolism protein UlaG (beta-lactamase superfamily)|nr:MBL fold metallo-hydrolase [Nitrolancea sp.]